MLVSYAQNFEDVMLWRALKHVEKGLYVDVGAQHPVVDSVSCAFYEHGWRGIHIEPVLFYANLLRGHRPDELVIQAAVGAKPELLTFFDIKDTGLSTADRGTALRHQEAGFQVSEISVPCLTLDEVLYPLVGKEIHWLKIDVEGYERQVLEGWRSEIRPWIVVIESTLPLTQTESHQEWENLILDRGYKFAYSDGINRFFVSSEHADLLDAFRYGPNYFDDFALSASTPFCTNLNSKIQELSQQSQELESELRTRALQALEASRSIAEHEAELRGQNDNLRESLSAAQQRTALIQGKFSQSRERLLALETELSQLRSQSDAERERLVVAQLDAANVKGELAWSRERCIALEGDLAEARGGFDAKNAALVASQTRAEWLEREWNAAKGKTDDLSHSSHHWWTAAVGLNDELQTVYASRSWRMTTPLRGANLLVIRTSALVRTALVNLISQPRRGVRWTLLKAFSYLQARQERKAQVVKLLARFPRMDAYLRAFFSARSNISRTPIAPSASAPLPLALSPELAIEASDDGIQWTSYSPSVIRAYRRLMEARASAHAKPSQFPKR